MRNIMKQERIEQILVEKHAQDGLRGMGVMVDLGDHRPYTEILAFIQGKIGGRAVADTCQLETQENNERHAGHTAV